MHFNLCPKTRDYFLFMLMLQLKAKILNTEFSSPNMKNLVQHNFPKIFFPNFGPALY